MKCMSLNRCYRLTFKNHYELEGKEPICFILHLFTKKKKTEAQHDPGKNPTRPQNIVPMIDWQGHIVVQGRVRA